MEKDREGWCIQGHEMRLGEVCFAGNKQTYVGLGGKFVFAGEVKGGFKVRL